VNLFVQDGKVERVRSNMGRPRFERAEIPMTGPAGRVMEEDHDAG
jgi:diaminopimelate epimerase